MCYIGIHFIFIFICCNSIYACYYYIIIGYSSNIIVLLSVSIHAIGSDTGVKLQQHASTTHVHLTPINRIQLQATPHLLAYLALFLIIFFSLFLPFLFQVLPTNSFTFREAALPASSKYESLPLPSLTICFLLYFNCLHN